MKKIVTLLAAILLAAGIFSSVQAQDLQVNEKKIYDEFAALVPKDKVVGLDEFKKIHDEVLAGKKNAYIIDCRTHPEFYAFHIEGSDHIHAGHMYTIPRKIKDPNAEIYLLCRTEHRSFYVAGFLYKYGYKNIHAVKGGLVGWVKAGHPVVNQFAGKFVITEYHKNFNEDGKYRVREFHPY
ncbi:rhodanese-like domain-containing protein [Desulfonema magnum]|uniref:Rhodanese-like domain-containing protein n=1 Tax=Desulfonema magnum TaxID=45655 RepID=A0A975BVK1_9BACT|nr:rhodanese-like domain-containing protein [Desulfonema magnum]QTA92438.1 Rhodanese-like domain-containing protein [Desulfonema magnum]